MCNIRSKQGFDFPKRLKGKRRLYHRYSGKTGNELKTLPVFTEIFKMDDLIAAFLGYLSGKYREGKISRLGISLTAGSFFFVVFFIHELIIFIVDGNKENLWSFITGIMKDLFLFSCSVCLLFYFLLFIAETIGKTINKIK